jgi:hypothetical protein
MEEDDLLEEDLVDYEVSPERPGMDVNIITFSADCTIVGDDEPIVAQFNFGPKEVAFTKPKESVNHLKPLFVRGHIDGIPIAKMLVDAGAAVNLMPYSLGVFMVVPSVLLMCSFLPLVVFFAQFCPSSAIE